MAKIEKNHTFKEYDKKYGDKDLSVVSKKAADKDPSLLKGKKWWLIKDSYYQVKSNRRFLFIPLSLLVGGAITTAIAVPSVLNRGPVKFKVTFDSDNGSEAVVQMVEKGKKATPPENPTKPSTEQISYSFKNWQEESQSNEGFDFDTPITRDVTLKASYTEGVRYYTVTFDSDGGSEVAPKKTTYKGTIKEPTEKPTKNPTAQYSYEFNEWQKDGQKFDFNTQITSDITLKANYNLTTNKYTVKFVDEDGSTEIATSQTVNYGTTVTKPTDPTKEQTLEYNYYFNNWQKEDGTVFTFNTPITSNITLKANYTEKKWFLDDDYIKKLTSSNVGIERGVMINNQLHKVRLIDIDKDKIDDNGTEKTAHTTWEFNNLISDSDGNSLSWLWNDAKESGTENYDYTNSTIRYALTGQGNNNGNGSTILAAQKEQTTWSNTYNNKTILSMFPTELTDKLKTVKKSVGTGSTYVKTDFTDKLYLLSPIEMGYTNEHDKSFSLTYSYYNGHTSETDAIRIKKQVNNSIAYVIDDTNSPKIPNGSGHVYKGDVYNYAGYNHITDNTGGGFYRHRSPRSYSSIDAWGCDMLGRVCSGHVYEYAIGVAPAFCLGTKTE